MKIAELLKNYDSLTKKALKNITKKAFVPNPDIASQGQPQPGAQPPQAAPPQGQPPQPQGPPQGQPPQPQGPPQGQPPQQGAPPAGVDLMSEVMAAAQQLPPQLQQQVAPMLQQLQSLPQQQRDQQLMQLLQQIQAEEAQQGAPQQGAPQQGAPPQGGMVAQASSEEDIYGAMQGGGMPSQDPSALMAQQSGTEEADHAESSALEAKNQLDNVKVELTVRELLDLVSKGSASASLLKVKQLADSHKQKMEQTRQKADATKQQAQQQQQSDQQGMMGGGIYPAPMGGM